MTLVLTLREEPAVPLEAEALCPDALAGRSASEVGALEVWHGNRRARVGDFFDVAGRGGEEVRIEGDLRRVDGVGTGMTAGRLTIAGHAGTRTGRGMLGGDLLVEGDAGDSAGAGMGGGRLVVRGSVGRRLGGAVTGERAGMHGGEIVVLGDAGDEVGAGLRRGLIAVAGRVGDAAGLRMLAGTVVALGDIGARPGLAMRRGTIAVMGAASLLPTFALATSYRPPFLALCLRRLRTLGLPISDEQVHGRYARWSGDGVELRRGEILILERP